MQLAKVLLTPKAARKWQVYSDAERQSALAQMAQLDVSKLDVGLIEKLVVPVLISKSFLVGLAKPGCRAKTSELAGIALSTVLSGSKLYNELHYAASWAKATGRQHRLEVVCRVGRADIVFDREREVVEAKFAVGWKAALGQALAYKYDLQLDKASLLLIGKPASLSEVDLVVQACSAYGVQVYWC